MATHRYFQALTVTAASLALVASATIPAEASTRSAAKAHAVKVAKARQAEAARRAHVLAVRKARQAEAARRAHVLAVRRAREATAARAAAARAAGAAQVSEVLTQLDTPVPTVITSAEPTVELTELPADAVTDLPTDLPTDAATLEPVDVPTENPAAEAPVVDVPAVEAPVAEVPVVETPLVEAAVATAPAGSPSGQAAPRGDLPGWHQTYAEDFTTNVATGSFPGAYGSHWYAYTDGLKDTSKNGTYMPSKVLSVHDGVLDYSIRTENGQHLVAAPVLKDTYGQVYGRYSVRFRADSMTGYKNAWLLWPDSERWPTDGEIDFPEGDLDQSIDAFSHFANANGGQDHFGSSARFSDWHTATIEWVPGKVSFLLDGKVLGSSTTNVPTTAMHWVMQTETTLSGAAPGAGVKGHVLIDWVALYTRA